MQERINSGIDLELLSSARNCFVSLRFRLGLVRVRLGSAWFGSGPGRIEFRSGRGGVGLGFGFGRLGFWAAWVSTGFGAGSAGI